jgi:putative copper resistance protein D
LFEIAMRGHATHVAMMLHFLLGGYLFFWVIIGIDPAPRRVPYPARMVMLLGAMAFHAMFGVAMMMAGTVIAEDWYRSLGRPWGGSLLADQGLGGGIAWAFGELPSLVVLAALFVQWVRSDERAARRHDRREDAGNDDSLERYNAYLAGLAEQDERQSR